MICSIIVAYDRNRGIGKDNQLIWHLSEDLKRFKLLTMGHHMIMGRKNYESIGRLLPGRTSLILSRNPDYKIDGALTYCDLSTSLKSIKNDSEVFIIGGAEVYKHALQKKLVDKMYITEIAESFDADCFFPNFNINEWDNIETSEWLLDVKVNLKYRYLTLVRIGESI